MRISDWSADVCSSDLPGAAQAPLPKDSADLALARLDHLRNANGGSPTAEIRTEMQRAMSAHAAVFRPEELMAEGKEKRTKTYQRMNDINDNDRTLIWTPDRTTTIEPSNPLIAETVKKPRATKPKKT